MGWIPPEPVLVDTAAQERLAEGPDPVEHTAAGCHVGAPHEFGVLVLGTEIERGDRRRLATAGAGPTALQDGPDRAAEDLVARIFLGAGDEGPEPAGQCVDVVVDAHD